MSKKTIPITEGRKNLFKITEEVQKPSTYYTFTVGGKPQAVLMSAEEFDSIMETMEIVSDPQVMAHIKKSEEEFAQGEYKPWSEFKKELKLEEVSVIREKSKKKYKTSKKTGKPKR